MLFSGRSLQSTMALLVYSCQRVRIANGVNLLFALQLFEFFGVGARGSVFRWNSTLGDGVFGIYMPACWKGENAELLFFVLTPSNVSGPGGGVFGESLRSATALLTDICQQGGRGSALNRSRLCFRR